jgi:hypothetical protein
MYGEWICPPFDDNEVGRVDTAVTFRGPWEVNSLLPG